MKRSRTWLPAAVAVVAFALAMGLLGPPVVRVRAGEAGGARAARRPPRIPDTVEAERDVEYGKGGDRALRLDIYRPKTRPEKPMPVLVYIHGGAWRAGSKAGMPPLGIKLAEQGYVSVSIAYRFSHEAIFPAQIEDAKCAVRFLRAHAKQYHIDPDRIGAWGHSAGGHLVALLGTAGDAKDLEGTGGWADQSSRVHAVVDCFGPTDFLKITDGLKTLGLPDRMGHDSPDSPEARLIGGPIQENKEKAARANPITYVTKDDPPLLILHGDRDATVPSTQSQLLYDALKEAGVDATYHVVKGAGHGFGGPEIDEIITSFFAKHLKKP